MLYENLELGLLCAVGRRYGSASYMLRKRWERCHLSSDLKHGESSIPV